ncbi:MAG: tetratricopeptide repeat protein, partial [Pontibacterium sp.]
DVDTIHAQLPAMLPDIMPAQGSRADKALKLAGDMLKQAGIQGGNILLVSDEVSPAQVAAEASRLRQQGRQLSILALGTEEGAPIPVSTGQIKDKQGRVVLARMQMHLMQEAAALGGGNAVKLVNDDSDLNRLIAGFSQDKRTTAAPGAEVDHWVAQGPWFVLLALLLLLPVFRRGILNLLLPALFIGVLIPAPDAEAGLWQDLWQSPDQQGAQLYKQGDKAAAAEQFDNPRWKQVSQYDDGQYEAALESLPIPETAADWYNRANTLTRNGQLDDAIAAYEKALELQPAHEAAAHNKKLLEDLKQQQEEQEQPQKQDQNQQGKEGDQQHSEDAQDGQQQQNSQQNNKNQRQKDQQNSDKKNADQNQGNTQEQSSSDAGQSGSNQEKTQDKPSQQSDEPGQMTAGEQEKQQAKEEARQAADYLKQQLNQRKPEKQEQTEAASSVGQSGQPTPVDEAEQARQQLLNRIVDDPAGLWRRKFIYQYRQQAEQPSAEEKLW